MLAAALLAAAPRSVDVLTPSGGLPAHIVSLFTEPSAFAQADSGEYVVLDRRGHSVYVVDPARTRAVKIISIGPEVGHLLRPSGFAMAPGGLVAVADEPGQLERVQYFGLDGKLAGGFYRPPATGPRLRVGPLVLNGLAALQFNGHTFLVSAPETGSLISELDRDGNVVSRIGVLRPTGSERDRELHLSLNAGLPLFDPAGGYYYVFQGGRPMFRKYDASGELLFERHIEGPELDGDIQALPTIWPVRPAGIAPLVPPHVRTATVDPAGRLWITLMHPFTLVYDRTTGDKLRTVQFRATGDLAAISLFFPSPTRVLVTPGCYEFAIKDLGSHFTKNVK